MRQPSIYVALVCALCGVAQANLPPLMYEHGHDIYVPKLFQPMVAPMIKPFQYEWRENAYQGEEDFPRWLPPKEDFGQRFGKQLEWIYPNNGPVAVNGYGQLGGKVADHEQPGYVIDGENIPITIMFKTPSAPLQQQHLGENFARSVYSDDGANHMIHRVTKPVIQEIHEIITPLRKPANHDIVQVKEELKPSQNIALPPIAKYLTRPNEGIVRNYSLMKDKNSHNFGTFNKLYDLGLQMNKANGYVLSGMGINGMNGVSALAGNHQATSQGHTQDDIDEPEPEPVSSEESNSKTQQA